MNLKRRFDGFDSFAGFVAAPPRQPPSEQRDRYGARGGNPWDHEPGMRTCMIDDHAGDGREPALGRGAFGQRGEQGLGVGMLRVGEQLFDRCFLDNIASIHDDDAAAGLGVGRGFRHQALITGTAGEDPDLTVPAAQRAGHQGLARGHAGGVDRFAGGKIVGTVSDASFLLYYGWRFSGLF